MKIVYVFTWPKCRGCNALKEILTKELISYTEVNALAPENKKLWDDISSQTGSIAVPMVFIQENGTNEGLGYVHSQDWSTTEELVEIIKKNIY